MGEITRGGVMLQLCWKMCCNPQETIQKVLSRHRKKLFYLLAGIYGLPIVLHLAQMLSLGSKVPLGLIWLFALILAPMIGAVLITILSTILFWVGKLFKGKATKDEMIKMFAWANLPMTLSVAGWIILSLVFGYRVFTSHFINQLFSSAQESILLFASILQFAAVLWPFFLIVKSLVVIQRYSLQKAVMNVAIPYFIYLIFTVIAG